MNRDDIRVLYFTAEWCTACKGYKPHLLGACKDLGVELITIDADKNAEYCIERNVTSLPTTIIEYWMQESDRIAGAVGKAELMKRIRQAGDE